MNTISSKGSYLVITPYIYVPFVAWLVAQGIKMIIEVIKGDADLRYLYASGGMPSSHSAVVCCLAVYTLYHQGSMSSLFGVTAILAAIVMYDSFGVRRSAGEQAKTLNKLIGEMAHNGNLRKPDDYSRLHEILGHQPLEVLVGALLGVLIATLFSLDQLTPFINWLTAVPIKNEVYVVFAIGAAMMIAPIILWVAMRKKLKKNRKLSELNKYFVGSNIILGGVVLFAGFVAHEQIIPYGQRWAVISLFIMWLIALMIVAWRYLAIRKVVRFSDEIIATRKQDWLKKAGKKK